MLENYSENSKIATKYRIWKRRRIRKFQRRRLLRSNRQNLKQKHAKPQYKTIKMWKNIKEKLQNRPKNQLLARSPNKRNHKTRPFLIRLFHIRKPCLFLHPILLSGIRFARNHPKRWAWGRKKATKLPRECQNNPELFKELKMCKNWWNFTRKKQDFFEFVGYVLEW